MAQNNETPSELLIERIAQKNMVHNNETLNEKIVELTKNNSGSLKQQLLDNEPAQIPININNNNQEANNSKAIEKDKIIELIDEILKDIEPDDPISPEELLNNIIQSGVQKAVNQ